MMKNETKSENKQTTTTSDESLVGGKYHGPSNQAGLTDREYWEMMDQWEDEKYEMRNNW